MHWAAHNTCSFGLIGESTKQTGSPVRSTRKDQQMATQKKVTKKKAAKKPATKKVTKRQTTKKPATKKKPAAKVKAPKLPKGEATERGSEVVIGKVKLGEVHEHPASGKWYWKAARVGGGVIQCRPTYETKQAAIAALKHRADLSGNR